MTTNMTRTLSMRVRYLNSDVHHRWEPDAHAIVECYDEEVVRGFPVGLAFVTLFENFQLLDLVSVVDAFRRQQIGTRIVRFCRTKWPNIQIGKPFDTIGESFITHLTSPPQYVPSWIRHACGEGRSPQ